MSSHDVRHRQPDHDRIAAELAEFEQRGGCIQRLPQTACSDRKHSYGRLSLGDRKATVADEYEEPVTELADDLIAVIPTEDSL